MAESSSFESLSLGVQKWIYRQGWSGLREIQEVAVPVVLAADHDILITAPTAGGKTEAAFLPIVSFLEHLGEEQGYGALCLSPLKALINDQFLRLEPLCESAQTRITPWHGDVSQSAKNKSWRRPEGLLMITPESLEAMFILRPHELAPRVKNLKYVVIDEFHAFIGRERGQQLISLLSRLEDLLGRPVCRIALSATIGDPQMALDFLRPDMSRPGIHLDAESEKMALKLLLKAYSDHPNGSEEPLGMVNIIEDLYAWLRGENHLLFANSRRSVEELTDGLTTLSAANHLPNEFFAHHGSLSKDARHYLESRLKAGDKPTTGVATATLELGIDIGDVMSVAQVGPPSNVSSMRQRLGRSGRREGNCAVLRSLVISSAADKDPTPMDRMEVSLVQASAVVELMLQRWVEPPDARSWHLSTLVQQVLSMIAYHGGQKAGRLYEVLCRKGPWNWMEPSLFGRVLKGMGEADYLKQLTDGELIVGVAGERVVSSHEIYTAFETPEEFRVVAGTKELGSLPVDSPLLEGQLVVFAGRRWEVVSVNKEAKVISVKKAAGGKPPRFSGEKAPVHRLIREKMLEIYQRTDEPAYMDEETISLLVDARSYFREQNIQHVPYVSGGKSGYWFVWAEDAVMSTLLVAFSGTNLKVDIIGPCMEVMPAVSWSELLKTAREGLDALDAGGLDKITLPFKQGKFDELLPDALLSDAFKAAHVDIKRAKEYVGQLSSQ